MGIDLGDVVVRRPTSIQALAGQRVAIDAWNILYQFLASIRQPDGSPLTDSAGRVTSHLAGLLYRTSNLVEAGIKPVFVFDGPPHELKKETLAARAARKQKAQGEYDAALAAGDLETARTKAQQTSRLTAPMVEEAKALLHALGLPTVQAPGEGEAQASWMAANGHAAAAVSQDFDALLFGAPRLVRHLATGGRRKLPGKQVWVDIEPEEIPLAESLAQLRLSREQLVDAALLVGTDFHPGVKGIGAKKAVALVQGAGSLELLLERIEAKGAASAAERAIAGQLEGLADRDAVRRIFLEPAHGEVGDLSVRSPDAAQVKRLMVDGHGFGAERVENALLKFAAARGKRSQTTLF